jgi:ribosomal protein L37AE/L43A
MCDLCERKRDDVEKDDGIWVCKECNVKYPKEED